MRPYGPRPTNISEQNVNSLRDIVPWATSDHLNVKQSRSNTC